MRDEIQRLTLAHRHYGYRRITVLLRRFPLYPNLPRHLLPTAMHQLWWPI